jgi:CIC family chloride channel protein
LTLHPRDDKPQNREEDDAGARLSFAAYLVYGGTVVAAAAGAVGSVWLFVTLYATLRRLLYAEAAALLPSWASWATALIPAVGGVVAVLLVERLRGADPVPNLATLIDAVALREGQVRARRGLAYAVGAIVSLGVGVPVGEDTPSALVGAHAATWIGRRFRRGPRDIEALIVMGTAVGIAFAYDAQLAGVVFALEVVLGGFGGWRYTIPVLIGAGMSTALALLAGGRQGTFMLPADAALGGPGPIILSLVVALAGAAVGVIFLKFLSAAEPLLLRIRLPLVLRAALVGALVGGAGLGLPQVLGTGIEDVKLLFGGHSLGLGAMLALVAMRTLLTPLCLKNGFIGGIIGPSLAIGAALGVACAQIGGHIFPEVAATPNLFAMVGAAAVLAATSHAPVFAAIFIYETTGDARLIAPVLLISALAYFISRRYHAASAYTYPLVAQGIHVQPGRNRLVSD